MEKDIEETIKNYTHFIELPFKIVGCRDWFPKPKKESHLILNNLYLAMVIFVLTNLLLTLEVNLYTDWIDIMGSLDKMADGLPLIVAVTIVLYFAVRKEKLQQLVDFMNVNFKYHSARGLTNMTMRQSYEAAKKFAYTYTACTLFSVTMYVSLPMLVYVWTKQPLEHWVYMDVSGAAGVLVMFLHQCVGQVFVGLSMGQLGVFFASNAILLCGQLDLLCCSVRNARHSACLQSGVQHSALMDRDMLEDERHSYLYNKATMKESFYHYDKKEVKTKSNQLGGKDMYNAVFDDATVDTLRDCARACQVVAEFKELFEAFVSPLLALRVIQVTLYLCTLLYAASLKFEMTTVEYLMAVALDIFVYCYYGNQIILQASRLSTAAYQSAWHTMGMRPRKLLLNILLANRRPVVVRAAGFLPMDLHTFLIIIKTSFSYYTLLVSVNDNKN